MPLVSLQELKKTWELVNVNTKEDFPVLVKKAEEVLSGKCFVGHEISLSEDEDSKELISDMMDKLKYPTLYESDIKGSTGYVLFDDANKKIAYKATSDIHTSVNALLTVVNHHPEVTHSFLALPTACQLSSSVFRYVFIANKARDSINYILMPRIIGSHINLRDTKLESPLIKNILLSFLISIEHMLSLEFCHKDIRKDNMIITPEGFCVFIDWDFVGKVDNPHFLRMNAEILNNLIDRVNAIDQSWSIDKPNFKNQENLLSNIRKVILSPALKKELDYLLKTDLTPNSQKARIEASKMLYFQY